MTEPMFSEALVRYLDDLVPQRTGVLAEMEAEGRRTKFPIIGPTCGHFCYLVARLMAARRVFEMGSGYGYSTAWFARAIQANGGGKVIHTVWDESLSQRAQRDLAALGFEDIVEYRVAEAVAALRQTEGPFDIVFLDIDKPDYPAALDVIETKLRPGGALLADNLLLSGAILDEGNRSDRVQAIRTFTHRIMQGDVWSGSVVPLRDGLLLAMKR
jgi:predicted O-methyltransferase YrrM